MPAISLLLPRSTVGKFPVCLQAVARPYHQTNVRNRLKPPGVQLYVGSVRCRTFTDLREGSLCLHSLCVSEIPWVSAAVSC
jgi:hypothetical protein